MYSMLGCFGQEKLEGKKKSSTYRKRFNMNVQVQNESLGKVRKFCIYICKSSPSFAFCRPVVEHKS